MSKSKLNPARPRPKRSRPRKNNMSGMFVLGVGLILVGAAAFLLWPRPDVSANSAVSGQSLTVPVAVDYEAPELTLSDLEGVEHSLADYRGKVVLVNLWATWCPPCKAEMPTLDAYYQAHQADGFVTLAINDGDPTEDVADFVQEYKLTFPVLLDPTYEASERAFKSLNLPSSFVIDREGQIRLRWVGEIDRAALDKYVSPLISE